MRSITSSRAKGFSIGELSKHSGVNVETIRYYERMKMLPAPPRAAERAAGLMGRQSNGHWLSSGVPATSASRLRKFAPCWR